MMFLIPRILRPEYTWPQRMAPTIRKTAPPPPPVPGKLKLRVWGLVHKVLFRISRWYSELFSIPYETGIFPLPFGLILKWNGRTTIEEYAAMQMARAAGMPVPKALCCGEHPDGRFECNFSILMTRLDGISLINSRDPLDVEAEEPWLFELKECVTAMRMWESPYGDSICSAIGTSIYSCRVPRHVMGPFVNEEELNDFLIVPAWEDGFKTPEEYQTALTEAKKIRECHRPRHRVTFTHGDLKAHNILVGDDGRLSGLLDWGSGGWYPEYWDFTTSMRFGRETWWYYVMMWMGGDQYTRELASDIALNRLTVDSYVAF